MTGKVLKLKLECENCKEITNVKGDWQILNFWKCFCGSNGYRIVSVIE